MSTNESPSLVLNVASTTGLVGSMKDLALAARKLGISVEKSSDLTIAKMLSPWLAESLLLPVRGCDFC